MRLFFFFFFIQSAFAHQTSMTSSGRSLYWVNKNIPVQIRPANSDLDDNSTQQIILNSIAEWNNSSNVRISPVSSSRNQIRFEQDFSMYGPAIVGLTAINYNSSGSILSASVLLNDSYFFQATAGYYGSYSLFLGDVVTHEIGHLLGLSHSEVLNSSMFYTAFPGQSTLSLDDKSGVREKYGPTFGEIFGNVRGGNQVGVLGVHVQAISRKTGEVAAAFTNEKGQFRIGGLDLDDSYYLYTSPMKNHQSLPGYFSNAQSAFCPGSFVGSFFSPCGRENEGLPHAIGPTTSYPSIDVGTITINCNLKASEEYNYKKLQSSFTPLTVFDYREEEKLEKAFVGFFRRSEVYTWSSPDKLKIDLSGYNGSLYQKYLKVRLVSQPFGNELEYKLRLAREGEAAQEAIKNYAPWGVLNLDLMLSTPMSISPSLNIFEIEIEARRIEEYLVDLSIPSSETFGSGAHQPYLIIMSLEDALGNLLHSTEVNLSDNESCLEAPFTYMVKKTGSSDSSMLRAANDGGDAMPTASCGSIEPPNDGGPGSFLFMLCFGIGFSFLPFLSKKAKKFLS